METIRRRVSKMEVLGVIEGWSIVPNPHLLGMECMVLYFETLDDAKKWQSVENLGRLEGVTSVHSFHGGSLLAFLEYPKGVSPEEQVALAETSCGTSKTMAWNRRFPPFELAMTPTDWLVLRSLRSDPRRKLSEIAREVGISSRTLNRRMERLVEGGAFFLEPIVNFQKIGRLSFTLIVQFAGVENKRPIDGLISRKLGNLCEVMDTNSSLDHSVFSLFCDNLTEAKEIHEWVRSLNGVLDVRMGIHEGRNVMTSWIDTRITAMNPVSRPLVSRSKTKARRSAHPYSILSRIPRGIKSGQLWWTGSILDGRRVKVMLDSAICMGTGSCVEIAPKVFKLDRGSKKSFLDPTPLRILKDRTANLEEIFLAAQSCPYRVIKLEDADTGDQLFP